MEEQLIYLASPYTAHSDEPIENAELQQLRYAQACTACGLILQDGFSVYSPIAHWHVIDLLFGGEIGYEEYLASDCNFIKRCDKVLVLMLDGWKTSRGVQFEIKYAGMHNKPVEYIILTSDKGVLYDQSPN